MSAIAVEYVRQALRDEGVDDGRIAYVLGEMQAGREWHPKTYAELRVALGILVHSLERRPVAVECLSFLGQVLEEDCV